MFKLYFDYKNQKYSTEKVYNSYRLFYDAEKYQNSINSLRTFIRYQGFVKHAKNISTMIGEGNITLVPNVAHHKIFYDNLIILEIDYKLEISENNVFIYLEFDTIEELTMFLLKV